MHRTALLTRRCGLAALLAARARDESDGPKVYDFERDGTGRVWGVASSSVQRLHTLDEQEHWQPVDLPEFGNGSVWAAWIARRADGTIVCLRRLEQQIYRYSEHLGDKSTVHEMFVLPYAYSADQEGRLFCDSKGGVWLTQDGPNIYRFNAEGQPERMYHFPTRSVSPKRRPAARPRFGARRMTLVPSRSRSPRRPEARARRCEAAGICLGPDFRLRRRRWPPVVLDRPRQLLHLPRHDDPGRGRLRRQKIRPVRFPVARWSPEQAVDRSRAHAIAVILSPDSAPQTTVAAEAGPPGEPPTRASDEIGIRLTRKAELFHMICSDLHRKTLVSTLALSSVAHGCSLACPAAPGGNRLMGRSSQH